MKILAVDTATESCSLAVLEFNRVLAEVTNAIRQTHSRRLMQMVAMLMQMTGITIHDIDGFAIANGPGSFTGLRIGLSTIKGLAAASKKPVVGISNLDALAHRFAFFDHFIYPLLDARKGEVYGAVYRYENGKLKKLTEEKVFKPEKSAFHFEQPCLFVGNGALLYQNIIKESAGRLASFADQYQYISNASAVGRLAVERFDSGNTDNIANLAPRYIRKSDAELKGSLRSP